MLSNDAPPTRIAKGGYFRETIEPGSVEYLSKVFQDKGPFNLEDWVNNNLLGFVPRYSLEPGNANVVFLRWTPNIFKPVPTVERVDQAQALSEMSGLEAFLPAVPSDEEEPHLSQK